MTNASSLGAPLKTALSSLFFCAASLLPGAASATDINGFVVESISPDEVQDRFGRSAPFLISLAECEYFLGISHEACDLTGSDGTTTDVVTSDTTTVTDTAVTDTAAQADDTAVEDTGATEADVGDVVDVGEAADTASAEDAGATEDASPGTAPGKADTASTTTLTLTVTMSTTAATTSTTLTAAKHTQIAWAVGKSCPVDSEPKDDSTNCKLLQGFKNNSNWSGLKIEIALTDLLSEDCASDADTYVWVYAKSDASSGAITTEKIEFNADYTPPTAPSITGANPGEQNVTVTWEDNSTETSLKHKVYYATRQFGSADIVAGASDVVGSGELTADGEYQVTGLENGTTYYFGVTTIDDSGNETQLCSTSELLSATPIELDDFYEYYKKHGGKEEGGFTFCFVATAAWGSPIAPAVNWLRAFRDQRMMASAGGRALVSLYGEVGPKAARVIAQNEWLRTIARGLLWPLVGFVILVMAVPAWGPVAGILGLVGLGSWVRRRRSNAERQESGR